MTDWAMELLAFLLTFLLHSSLLIGLVWLATKTRVVRAAATEDVLWKFAIVGGVVTAGLQLGAGLEPLGGTIALSSDGAPREVERAAPPAGTAPRVRPRRMPGRTSAPIIAEALSARETPARRAAPPVTLAAEPASSTAPAASTPDLRVVAAGMWALLAAVGLARFAGARRRLAALLATRDDVRDGALLSILARLSRRADIRKPVRLTASAALPGPIVVGRREICIPPRAVHELSPPEQEAMMAHEMAHVRRRDPLWLSAIAVLESVFFFQPLLRVARRRWQDTSEFLCDDWAVQATGRRLVMAQCLARVAGWVRSEPTSRLVPGMAHAESSLVQRVERLAESRERRAPRGFATAALCALLLTVVSCGVPSFVSDDSGDSWLAALKRVVQVGEPSDEQPATSVRTARLAVPAAWIGDDEDEDGDDDGSSRSLTLLVDDGEVALFVDGEEVALDSLAEDGVVRLGGQVIVLDGDAVHLLGPDGKAHMTLGRRAGRDGRVHVRTAPSRDRGDAVDRDDAHVRLDRALRELEREHQRLEREHARTMRAVQREYDEAMRALERDAERTRRDELRPHEERLHAEEVELHTAHERAAHELHEAWDRAVVELHDARDALLARRDEFDPDELHDRLEDWHDELADVEDAFEDRLEDLDDVFEERFDDWADAWDEWVEDGATAFEFEHDERLEDLEDAFMGRFDELERHFEDAAERLEEAYEEIEGEYEDLFDDLDDCDHDCEYRCREGCTHDDDGAADAFVHFFGDAVYWGAFGHEFDHAEWADWGAVWSDHAAEFDDAWAAHDAEWHAHWSAWSDDMDTWSDAWDAHWDHVWFEECDEPCDEPCEEPCDAGDAEPEPEDDAGAVVLASPIEVLTARRR